MRKFMIQILSIKFCVASSHLPTFSCFQTGNKLLSNVAETFNFQLNNCLSANLKSFAVKRVELNRDTLMIRLREETFLLRDFNYFASSRQTVKLVFYIGIGFRISSHFHEQGSLIRFFFHSFDNHARSEGSFKGKNLMIMKTLKTLNGWTRRGEGKSAQGISF